MTTTIENQIVLGEFNIKVALNEELRLKICIYINKLILKANIDSRNL